MRTANIIIVKTNASTSDTAAASVDLGLPPQWPCR